MIPFKDTVCMSWGRFVLNLLRKVDWNSAQGVVGGCMGLQGGGEQSALGSVIMIVEGHLLVEELGMVAWVSISVVKFELEVFDLRVSFQVSSPFVKGDYVGSQPFSPFTFWWNWSICFYSYLSIF